MKIRSPQHLIFDADDTLWENNIYFEDAFDRFCEFLNHSHLTPDQVRAALDEIEIVNNKIHGYGAKNFARNLAQCYRHLCERGIAEAQHHHDVAADQALYLLDRADAATEQRLDVAIVAAQRARVRLQCYQPAATSFWHRQ